MTGDRSITQPSSVEKEQNAQLNLLDIGASKATRVASAEPVTKPSLPGEPTKPPEVPPVKPPEKPPTTPTEPTKPPEKPPTTPTEPTKPPEKPPTTPTEPTKPPEKPPTTPTEPTKPPEKPPTEPTKPPSEPTRPPRPPERRRETAPVGYLELPDFAPRHHKETPPPRVEVPPPKVEVPPPKVEVPPPKREIPPPEVTPVIPPVVRTPELIPIKPVPIEPHNPPLRPTEPHLPHHKPPTGVFTGRGDVGRNAEQIYNSKFGSGKEMSAHHEHLIAPKIGLKVDVDAVGTGKDAGMRRHITEMVTPKDHDHLGQWKYDVPGKTIIAGHVKYNGQPGPMFKLRELGVHNGVKDTVVIEGADGKRTTYEYAGRTILKDAHDQKTWDKVFAAGDPEHKQLTLITCCGPVDKHGVHQWRLIVNLTEVKDEKAAAQSARRDTAPSALSTDAGVKAEVAPAKVETAPVKAEVVPPKSEVAVAKTEEQTAPAAKTEAQTAAAAKTEAQTAPAAKTDEVDQEPPHPQSRLDVITNAGPGTHGPQTRFIYTHPIEKHGALTGITGEVATTGDHLSYGQVGPNFSFLRDNDRYTLDSKIRLGYASGDNLFRSSNIPLQGLRGTTLSGQVVGTDRISDNTRLYAGGGAGYNFDLGMKQGFVEAGAQHLVNDKLVLRGGLQVSAADHYGVGTYAVTGVQYRPSKNVSFGLDVDQPISGRSSKSPTVFLSGTIRF